MDTNSITGNIVYSKYLFMQYMAPREFMHFAKTHGFYDELTFLDCFKDRGVNFWYEVLFLSKIDVKFLFERYEEEMMNPRLRKRIEENSNERIMNYNTFSRIHEYICEYEKYRKIDIWIEVK